jgi:hypothetical protein
MEQRSTKWNFIFHSVSFTAPDPPSQTTYRFIGFIGHFLAETRSRKCFWIDVWNKAGISTIFSP